MKVLFERKAFKEQIVPQDEFVIEKVVEIPIKQFNKFLDDMLGDYKFIEEHKDLMYIDNNNVWHSILVTAKEVDFGILVQSEGYSYARYSAYIRKDEIGVLLMEKQQPLNQWIKEFNEGKFDSKDTKVQIEAGWYDWFCKDTSLTNKTKKMGNIIKQIKPGGKVDLETSYVWFKNNCPLNGPLYDDFRIADIETNNTLILVQIDCVWNDTKYTVYERLFGFDKPVLKTNSSRDLVKWLNKGWNE